MRLIVLAGAVVAVLFPQELTFKFDGTRAEALSKLADQVGRKLVLPDDVREAMKVPLAESVTFTAGSMTLDRYLEFILKGSRMVHRLDEGRIVISVVKEAPREEGKRDPARADVVLVAKLDKTHPISYGPVRATEYEFTVLEVVRFEPAAAKNDGWGAEEIGKKNLDLKRYHQLYWRRPIRDDAKGRAEDAEFARKLRASEKLILVIPCGEMLTTMGRMEEDSWGTYKWHDLIQQPFAEETLKTIDAVAGKDVEKMREEHRKRKEQEAEAFKHPPPKAEAPKKD